MSETFTLSGDGLRGYGQHLMAAPLMEQEPVTVRLGRLAPVETGEPKLMLANYFGDAPKAGPLPEIVDWSAKAMASISRMYLNDRLGICVFASAAHQAGLWTANDMDSGGIVLADDDELRSQYRSVCGPFDSGCDIGNVLKYTRDEGLTAGGKKY